jgi:rhamnose transport system substrate-binding protein
MASDAIGGKGEIAILSATAQATNQNIWIKEMKKLLEQPEYKDLKLVDVVYGDDQSDKSYREAVGLFRKHPDPKAIIAPTTVGITASAKAVTDQNLIGKVLRDGPRPAVGDGWPRSFGRREVVRHLEPGRPRLHGDVRGL